MPRIPVCSRYRPVKRQPRYGVHNGVVDLSNPYGKATLRAGQSSTVSGPGQPPSPPKDVPQGQMPDWQNAIDVEDEDELLDRLEEEGREPEEKTLRLDLEQEGEKKSIRLKFKKGK